MRRKLGLITLALILIFQSFFGMTPITFAQDDAQVEEVEGSQETEQEIEEAEPIVEEDTDSKATEEAVTSSQEEGTDEEAVDFINQAENEAAGKKSTESEDGKANNKSKFAPMFSKMSTSIPPELIITSVEIYQDTLRRTDDLLSGYNGTPPAGYEKIEEIRPEQGSRIAVIFEWELPDGHGYGDGDTVTFALPDKFEIAQNLSGNLDGGVGTFTVTPSGVVTFTFNDLIEDGAPYYGYFYVWREFDEGKFTGGLEQQINFDFAGITIPVHFKGKGDKMTKTGSPNKQMNATTVDWSVDFNKGEESINGSVFKDEWPAGLSVDVTSIKVYELNVNLNGTVTQGAEVTSYPSPIVNGQEFTINFGNINKAYRVTYTTDVTDTTDRTYTNDAELSGQVDGNAYSEADTYSVNLSFSKPLAKFSPDYDSSTQTITWRIEYNYNERAIDQVNAWLEDTFDTSDQELVEDSFQVYEMSIADNGSASRNAPPLIKDADYTVTPNSTGFTFQFTNDVAKAYEIIYQTTAINRVYDQSRTVSNSVEMYGVADNETATRTINQSIFSKSQNPSAINYTTKQIPWTLTLNADKKTMTDVVITDEFAGQHMTFDSDSLSITGLTKGADYTVDDSKPTEGFTITFSNPITDTHTISYRTTFDPTNPVPSGGYRNSAGLDWAERPDADWPISRKMVATVTPDSYTMNNGAKQVSYNAQTKEFTWTLDVNYNLHDISNPIIRDFYSEGQTFVEDSLTVHQLIPGIGPNNYTVGDSFTNYAFEAKEENGKDGFQLTFNEPIDGAYRITYKTSLKGLPVEGTYSNEATLQDGPTIIGQSYNAQRTPNHQGEYIIKSGSQGTGAEVEIAKWQLTINRSQSFIEAGAELTDTLSDNQMLLEGSFKLVKPTVATNGTVGNAASGTVVDESKYDLVVNGNTFTLTFMEDIEESYILQYESFINANHNEQISNSASFEGQSAGAVNKNANRSFNVNLAGAGGGTFTQGKGNIEIVKVDEDTDAPLAGATFELYNADNTTLLATAVTDENGRATFAGYKYNKYVLKEAAAPDGYLVSDEYRNGKVIDFDSDSSKGDTEFTITNKELQHAFILVKEDSDDDSIKLAGAEYDLEKRNGAVYEFVESLTTDQQGIIAKGDLEPGDYRLIETKAPRGYMLDAAPIEFTIAQDQTVIERLTHKNEIYIGSVELLKRDDVDHTALQGAVFNLIDKSGNVVSSNLTTDSDGKIVVDHLRAGVYEFVEIQAPNDYVLDSTPIEFEILTDELVRVTADNSLISGSVKLTKIQKGSPQNKLEGAEFKIETTDGDTVKENLVTDENGELIVDELRPGKYVFIETKAPVGYLASSEPVPFDIVRNQTPGVHTTVTVENILAPISPSPLAGSVQVTKIDKENQQTTLEGAEFMLLDEQGYIVKDDTGQELTGLTTNENGEFLVDHLKPGKYQLVETKAPAGYILDETPTEFEIIPSFVQLAPINIVVENERVEHKGSVKLIKVEKKNISKRLAGAEFKLLDHKGDVVKDENQQDLARIKTNQNGEFVIKGLAPNQYQLIEIKAPEGYKLDKTPIPFTIYPEGSYVEILFENEAIKEKPEKPKTPNKPDGKEELGGSGNPNSPGSGVKDDSDKIDGNVKGSGHKEDSGSNNGNSGSNNVNSLNGSKNGGSNSLPQTGEQASLFLALIAAMFITVGIWLLFSKRRKRED